MRNVHAEKTMRKGVLLTHEVCWELNGNLAAGIEFRHVSESRQRK